MKEYRLTIIPGDKIISLRQGTLLLDALDEAGIPVNSPCGGRGTCGRCLVEVSGALTPIKPAEEKFLKKPGLRLACQAALEGDAMVAVPASSRRRTLLPESMDTTGPFALAVDLGTTTVQISLVDLEKKSSMPLDSFLNPQRRFGHDVISRISAARENTVRQKLTEALRRSVSASIERAFREADISPASLKRVVMAGNTVMSCFMMGLDVTSLGAYPYTLPAGDFETATASSLGLDFFGDIPVDLLPPASAYVGGDITGGLALLDSRGIKDRAFFMDIGTNGEMFLRIDENTILATSCAMGPALEGMNMSHGMTAGKGAVTHIRKGKDRPVMEVMGGGEPMGLSGTGVIDALALTLESGIMDRSGAFSGSTAEGMPAVESTEGVKELRFHPMVSVTQKDIRNIQLAKGASLAAATLLLKEARFGAADVKRVFIAGTLGLNLDMDNFRTLGFLPEFPGALYEPAGNTSLMAAEQACMDTKFFEGIRALRDRMTVLDISAHPDFNGLFIECLNF